MEHGHGWTRMDTADALGRLRLPPSEVEQGDLCRHHRWIMMDPGRTGWNMLEHVGTRFCWGIAAVADFTPGYTHTFRYTAVWKCSEIPTQTCSSHHFVRSFCLTCPDLSWERLSKVHREVEGLMRPQGSNDVLQVLLKTANLLRNQKQIQGKGIGCRLVADAELVPEETQQKNSSEERAKMKCESWWTWGEGDVTIARNNAEIIVGDTRNDWNSDNKIKQEHARTCSYLFLMFWTLTLVVPRNVAWMPSAAFSAKGCVPECVVSVVSRTGLVGWPTLDSRQTNGVVWRSSHVHIPQAIGWSDGSPEPGTEQRAKEATHGPEGEGVGLRCDVFRFESAFEGSICVQFCKLNVRQQNRQRQFRNSWDCTSSRFLDQVDPKKVSRSLRRLLYC